MAVAVHDEAPLSLLPAPRETRRPRLLEMAAGAGGAALAVLVGVDGSPGWQMIRVAAVAAVTALLVVGQLRLPAPWRGRLSVLFGVPAIAIALGFSPHWAKSGPVPVQFAAAVLALAGVGLTIGGTVVATRGRRWPRRAATSAAVLVATAVTAYVAGPAVAATNVPRPGPGATPVSAGVAFEDVTLRTDDGVRLAAWYLESTNQAAVVLLHGAGSTRSNVLDHAAVLSDAGFGVLLVDARGHGQSSGRAMDFGWHGDSDIAAATAYLAARPDVDPQRIGVVGMSMGGEEALGASGRDPLVRAVVAEGATGRSARDDAWFSDRFGIRGTVQEQLERVQDWVTDPLTSARVPTSSRAAVEASGDTRYLLITAGGEPDERYSATYVAGGAPERVEIWTVPEASHTGGLEAAPEEWTQRVVGFLRDSLLGDAGVG